MTADLRREISGILLVALGILGYLSLGLPQAGWLGRDLGHGLTFVFGLPAWLVPLLAIVAGTLKLLNRPRPHPNRAAGSGLILFAAALGLYFADPAGAGWLGGIVGRGLVSALGTPGTILLILVSAVVGLALLRGGGVLTDFEAIAKTAGRGGRWVGRSVARGVTAVRDWVYPEEPVPAAPRPRRARRPRPAPVEARAPEPAWEAPAAPAPEPPLEAPPPPIAVVPRSGALPPLTLLASPEPAKTAGGGRSATERADILIASLHQFGIEARLGEVHQGPTITRFEVIPPPGVKVSRIVNLADDIALSLAATGVRIEAPIPGKSAVGIEIPNDEIATVLMREVLESPVFQRSPSPLTVALGRDVAGVPMVADLAQMPHLLVAGATGSGKSVLINVLISSLLFRADPKAVRLLLIDPKVVELSIYNGIPHLISPVVTDPKKAAGALRWTVVQMEERYRLFAAQGVRDMLRYNQAVPEAPLHYIVVVIDELADLMMVAPTEVEESIARLAQMARAAGIHLVVATQRPSVDVITGTIKANIPSRIAFAVSSQVDSRTILDAAGAEKLLGRGDMLFNPVGAPKPQRLQGAFITEREIEAVVQFLSQSAPAPAEDGPAIEFTDVGETGPFEAETDALFESAVRLVVESGQASTSMLQRRLRIGYTRAARLIDSMEERGFVGPPDGARAREVKLTGDQFDRLFTDRPSV